MIWLDMNTMLTEHNLAIESREQATPLKSRAALTFNVSPRCQLPVHAAAHPYRILGAAVERAERPGGQDIQAS